MYRTLLLSLAVLALVACGQEAPTPKPTATVTLEPTATPEPVATYTVPPTPLPTATTVSVPTAKPGFEQFYSSISRDWTVDGISVCEESWRAFMITTYNAPANASKDEMDVISVKAMWTMFQILSNHQSTTGVSPACVVTNRLNNTTLEATPEVMIGPEGSVHHRNRVLYDEEGNVVHDAEGNVTLP